MRVSVRSGRALGALAAGLLLTGALVPSGCAQAQEAKGPNILSITGDGVPSRRVPGRRPPPFSTLRHARRPGGLRGSSGP